MSKSPIPATDTPIGYATGENPLYQREGHLSLEDVHSSIPVPDANAGFFKQLRAFAGPAILVSVGYMDPGNWGTDLAGGAQFKYGLLWVVAMASIMAIFLQIISARLGVVTGRDLAQGCRDYYPKWTRWPQWIMCELAIAACDLAEVLGSAVALNLMFHIPIFWCVIITAFDVMLLLALQRFGMRTIEAVILLLVATITVCYGIEIFVLPQTRPDFPEMGRALLTPGFRETGMAVVAIGIIGATVMPHNLYLHSALVQTRNIDRSDAGIKRALKFNTIDSVAALSIAFLVNASIMILAAITFYGKDSITVKGVTHTFEKDSDWIQLAYLTLTPLLGKAAGSLLFGIALLASGQSSTITGTMAGQVVMEGFMHWRLKPWIRRLITRSVAIIPAILIIGMRGAGHVNDLLIISQVVLAMQLPFAMFPLLHFTSSKKIMGKWRLPLFLMIGGWLSAIIIAAMDFYGLPESAKEAWRVIIGH